MKDRTVGHNLEGNPLETILFLFDFIWIKHLIVKQNYTNRFVSILFLNLSVRLQVLKQLRDRVP